MRVRFVEKLFLHSNVCFSYCDFVCDKIGKDEIIMLCMPILYIKEINNVIKHLTRSIQPIAKAPADFFVICENK